MIPAAIVAIFGPIINLITAVVGSAGTVLQGTMPLMQGLSSLVVWYFKELYQGFVTVFNNFSVVVLIATLVGGTTTYAMHQERAACYLEVQKQRDYDAWKYAEQAKHKASAAPAVSASPVYQNRRKPRR